MNKKKWIQVLATKNEIGTLLPLVIMCIVVTLVNPNFISFSNLMDIFRTTSFYLIVGAALTFLLVASDLDLSIGAVTALGGVATVYVCHEGRCSRSILHYHRAAGGSACGCF